MSVTETELRGFGIHHLCKRRNVSRHLLCDKAGGIVRACEEKRIQKLLHREFFAFTHIYRRAFDSAGYRCSGDYPVERAFFDSNEGGHYLGRACHGQPFIGVFLKQNGARRTFEQESAFCTDRHIAVGKRRHAEKNR